MRVDDVAGVQLVDQACKVLAVQIPVHKCVCE